MNNNDPSKKASINSLLNPQHEFNYSLRAAQWGNPHAGIEPKTTDAPPRQFNHQHIPAQNIYTDSHPPRITRDPPPSPHRFDNYHYPSHYHHNSWPHPQQSNQSLQYPPMYSDERTALPGDYHSHNSYDSAYQSQSSLSSTNAWQQGDRASIRLVARGTIQPQDLQAPPDHHPQHDTRYSATAAPTYYPPVMHPVGSLYAHHSSLNHPEPPLQPQYPQSPGQPEYSPRTLHTPQIHPAGQPPAQQGQEQPVPRPQSRPDVDSDPEGSNSSIRKRSQPDSEGQTEPQPKRAKGKAKATSESTTSTGSSRRGYSAEKRSKAAQIAAQNVQMMPTVSYAPVPNENGIENDTNARMRIVTGDGGQINGLVTENAIPLQPELQFARCMSNRYRAEQFPRCVSCTRRWAGDTCRFQGIRFFLKDKKRDIVGISFVEGRYQDAPKMLYPTRWNVLLKEAHIKRMKVSIAKALLPILKKEHEHIKLPELIRRPRESEVRATCDTCMTSLFSCTWMCRLCGREACAECFAQVKELTTDKPNANQTEVAALQVRREKHAHSNPFFLSCTRRNEHMAKDFSPVSRFFKEELEEALPEMERLLMGEAGMSREFRPSGPLNGMPELSSDSNSRSTSASSSVGVPTPPPDSSALAAALGGPMIHRKESLPSIVHHGSIASPPYIPPNLPQVTASVPYHEIKRYTYAEVTNGDSISVFAPIWQRGDPIVVTGCLDRFKIAWTPEYFVKNYSEQTCLIIECQTDANKRVTVGQFFDMFGNYEGRSECWKLKDWPPSTDFKAAFPELYKDFSEAVPVPDYVRRDGVGNVGSHFPSNTIAPDLGPKMYNAMASSLDKGSKGSTRLHMDMADAVNIMTYTELSEDGSPGCAAWDLFRACDSEKIRNFLRQKFPKQSAVTDPIHSQQHYLDECLRKELYDQFGVMSYRVYQRPGEAIFIPAGCAHQVANLADCVKVAIDFVSVENIGRCEGLTKEFRELNQRLAWKEDVLQLRSMMWFAWLSCGLCEKGGNRSELPLGAANGESVGREDDGSVNGKRKGKGRKKVGSALSVTGSSVGEAVHAS
ncbi:hypothetical protein P691DRAFT_758956 [Macrolepiota fuliginosa MF-IS2]|uniref:JmjC domain-containing protein n=1 Tax=Macrolepiota fuliginosa MF-IS2 TaxID=1400762 RepID=A0A9P5XG07_9AGAR|nr:hypothetical protein P691DRAFT_758956 [Macrolepiota fuliginosa MF-IS2]